MRAFVAVCALATALSGCAETVVRSGLPAGNVANGYDSRWHDSFFFGAVEPSRLEPASAICPRGWSELRASASFAEALLQWSTLGIYTPTDVTVICAAPPGVYLGAPAEVPLAPMCR